MSNLPISLRSILITGFGALLALMLCTLLVLWAWRADDIATIALALALLAFGMLLGAWMIRRVLDHETAWCLAADQAEDEGGGGEGGLKEGHLILGGMFTAVGTIIQGDAGIGAEGEAGVIAGGPGRELDGEAADGHGAQDAVAAPPAP